MPTNSDIRADCKIVYVNTEDKTQIRVANVHLIRIIINATFVAISIQTPTNPRDESIVPKNCIIKMTTEYRRKIWIIFEVKKSYFDIVSQYVTVTKL